MQESSVEDSGIHSVLVMANNDPSSVQLLNEFMTSRSQASSPAEERGKLRRFSDEFEESEDDKTARAIQEKEYDSSESELEESRVPATQAQRRPSVHSEEGRDVADAARDKKDKFGLFLVFAFAGIIPIEFAVVIPTIWTYIQMLGGNRITLGIAVSGYNMAKTLCFPLIGLASDFFGFHVIFQATLFASLVGNVIYGLAGSAGHLQLVFWGRILSGIGSASSTITLNYVTRISHDDAVRMRRLAIMQSIQIPGLALGPVVALAFEKLNVHRGWFVLDRLTAPGYLMGILNALMALMFFFFFKEPEKAPLCTKDADINSYSDEQNMPLLHSPSRRNSVASRRSMLWKVLWKNGGFILILIKFMTGFQQLAFETALTPITEEQYGWGSTENALILLFISICVIIGVSGSIYVTKCGLVSSQILLSGFSIMGLGLTILLSACSRAVIPLLPAGIGSMFTTIGFPVINVASSALYAKAIGKKHSGYFFGLYSLAFGVSGIVAPIATVAALHSTYSHLAFFILLFLVFAICPLLSITRWKRFQFIEKN